jgi:addiction module RelE/StbE family toxin
MKILFSESFKKDYKKIKDISLRKKIIKAISKLPDSPELGKPLKYCYKGNRRLRVDPFRIFYRLEGDIIRITNFEHRKKAYRK